MMLYTLLFSALVSMDTCPLQVRKVSSYGLSIRAEGFNAADYPVDHVVAHVTVNDGFGQQHDLTYQLASLFQPNRSFVFTTPPIFGFVANFESADVSFTCRQVED